jgi:transcriptional regulator with XRE-family HTH domain
MSLAKRVKNLRIEMGLNPRELGEAIGDVPYQSIQNIESGKVTSPRYILDLARVLGVTPEYLLHGIDASGGNIKIPVVDTDNLDKGILTKSIYLAHEASEELSNELTTQQLAKLIVYLYQAGVEARSSGEEYKISRQSVIDLTQLII